MKKDFNYNDVPEGYIHCLNAQCSCSSKCLRFQLATLAGKGIPYFTIVNPSYTAGQERCNYFRPNHLIRYALGITHLYDELTHIKYLKIKKVLHDYFGHSHYYRIYNKQLLINPKDQDFIRKTFLEEGIETEPLFDEYIEKYDFSPFNK